MTHTRSKITDKLGQRFLVELTIGLCCLGMFGLPVFAQTIDCGDTLGPGGYKVLSGDLACDESPALTIVGPVHVDLDQFTVSCNENSGMGESKSVSIGIKVTGSRAKLSNGTVADCQKGVVVEGYGRHRLLELVVMSPEGEDGAGIGIEVNSGYNRLIENTITSPNVQGEDGLGIELKSDHNWLIDNTVTEFAGEGFRLGNDGMSADYNVLKYNEASNGGNHGFRVRNGEHNLLLGNTADANVGEGFRSQDKGNKFFANTATNNSDEGVRLRDETAQNNWVVRNYVEGNGFPPFSLCDPNPPGGAEPDVNPGIAVTRGASGNKIRNNTVIGNCSGIGVEAGSFLNKIAKNTVDESAIVGIVIAADAFLNKIISNTVEDSGLVDMLDQNLNCGTNRWRNNEFESSVAGTEPSPECIR